MLDIGLPGVDGFSVCAKLSVKNLGNAENTKDLLHSVLDESHKLEQYIH